MQHSKKIFAAAALLLAFSFLGIPIPDWLASFVSSIAGIITAIIMGFSNLMAFVQFFVHF